MKKKILLAVGLLFSGSLVFARQTSINPKSLKIGDNVSSYKIDFLINYPEQSLNFSDLSGKLVILDFWTFGCGTCIDSWPKLLKLQSAYRDKIQIILVNPQEPDAKKVMEFVRKREKSFGYKLDLPMSNGDKNIARLFPYRSVPHLIWIDPNGTVKMITGGSLLNEPVLKKMLAGETVSTFTKTDDFVNVFRSKPLFINGNGVGTSKGENIIASSIISPYTPDIFPSAVFRYLNGATYGWISNYTIRDMLAMLYGTGLNAQDRPHAIPRSNIVISMPDSSRLVDDPYGLSMNKYVMQFTARTKLPLDVVKRKMIGDLEATFGLKTELKVEKRKCLVISKGDKPIPVYTTGDKKVKMNMFIIDINKLTIPELIKELGIRIRLFHKLAYPMVDETNFRGYLGTIVAKDINMNSLDAVSKMLEQHGMKTSLQDRMVEVLVIRDQEMPVPY